VAGEDDSLALVQRLFSTFPGRWPGVGLLLLRAAVGVWAAIEGVVYLLDVGGVSGGAGVSATASPNGDPVWWVVVVAMGAVALLCGAALLIGFLTPIAALVVAVLSGGRALSWIPAVTLASDAHAGAWFMMIVALGIFFLGPGAYSLDSYLFGRREIIIPPRADTSPARDARQSTNDSRH
jgi:uncharacterized membrane protein YphA (DoxX/SURF4 family)